MEKLYTVKELSDLLEVNKTQVYRYINRLELKSEKMINGAKVYSQSDFQKLAESLGVNYHTFSDFNKNDNTRENKDNIGETTSTDYYYKAILNEKEMIISAKNETIKIQQAQLDTQKQEIDKLLTLLDQEQQLNLSKTQLLVETNTNKKWWQFWR